MKQQITSLALSIALILLAAVGAPSALADKQGTLSGQFSLANTAPSITSLDIVPAGGGAPVTSLTPGASYLARLSLSDANTLDDLEVIRVALSFDGGDADPSADPGESGDTHTRACLRWTKAGDAWTISPSGGDPATTWTLNAGLCTKPSNMSATTGTWAFYFTVGKVASEAAGGAGNDGWDLFCALSDGVNGVQEWPQRDYAVEWYGEITVHTGNVSWLDVMPGMDFGEDDASEQGGISITYIANGAYDEQVASAGSWAGSSGSAALNAAGSPGADQFSLMADDSGILAQAQVLQDVGSAYVTIDDSGTQTDDGGDTVDANTLWLKLGPSFSDGSYSGTIYYRVANGS